MNFFNPGGAFILGGTNSGNLTVNARDWGSEDVQFRAGGAGVISIAGAQTNIVDFSITTDADPTIGAAITGTGVLTLEPATAGTTMGLGGGAGALNYSSADLTALGVGWSSYVFGSTTQTGTLTTAAHTWANPVTWRAAAGGNIVVSGLQDTTAASNATFTFDGPTTLSANVSTVAATGGTRAIAFNSPVTLGADAQVLGGSGTVTFGDTVDGAHDLTVNTTGVVTFNDTVGGGTPPDDLTIVTDANPVIAESMTTTGTITVKPVTANTTIGLSGGAGTINLSAAELDDMHPGTTLIIGDSAAGTGAVNINAWDLTGETYDVEVYGGSVDFGGAVTFDQANDLTFVARAGDITLDQLITKSGGAASNLLLKATGSILQTATVSSSVGALNTTLWADSDNNAAGRIALTGAAINSLGGNVVLGGGTDPATDEAVGTANYGVELNNGDISTGAGTLSIRGRGEAAGANNYGIYVHSGSVLQSTSGNITLTGTGGAGTQNNGGVIAEDAGTQITSADGDISITGVGNGSTDFNAGLAFSDGTISSTGTGAGAGNITIIGTGASGANESNQGMDLMGFQITTVDGDIIINGTGGNSGGNGNVGILQESGSDIISTGTGADAGNISITAIGGGGTSVLAGQVWQTSSGFAMTDAGTTISVVDGDLTIDATGGTASSDNYGSYLRNGVVISSTGTGAGAGTITLNTDGGAGSGDGFGIWMKDNGTLITTVDGAITITATGGNAGDLDIGFALNQGADITSTGTGATAGSITIAGIGGTGGANDWGFYLSDAGTIITAVDGDISLTGTGGAGTGTTNYGIYIFDSVAISTTGAGAGAGNITIAGTGGGSGGGSTNNHGILLESSTQVTAAGPGTITMTGQVGVTSGDDIKVVTGANVIGGAAAGDVTLIGNTMNLANLTASSAQDITVRARTAGTTVGLGGGAGTLNLDDTELGFFDADGELTIGRADGTGTMTIDAYNAWNGAVRFLTDPTGSIVVTGAQAGAAASDATFTCSGPTSLGANVSTAAATGGTQDITFSDDVTLTGNAQVLAGNGDLLFSGTVDGAFDLTLSTVGTITLSDDVGAGTPRDDLTLTSDADPAIGGTVDGTGVLTLQQASNATTMGVAGGAGALNYSLADLAGLGANWTSLRLGSPTATGALTVGARAWDIPVDYRAAAAGSIVIAGAQTAGAASDTIFTFSGPATINAPLDLSNATGGTQAITFDDDATVNADITSGGGDIAFNDTLSLNADVATGGGDITLADDVTLTGTSSIDTDTADIGFDGTLNGTFDLTLSTTGDVDFSDDVGTGAALDDLAIAGAADVTFAGQLNAASFTLTGGTGAVLVTDAADVTNDIDITTTGTVTFGDNLVYGSDVAVDAGVSAIAFNGTVDGPGDFELTTTNDITFADDVGAVTRLGDVMLDPQHVAAAGVFNVGSFTLVNGTGNVSFLGLDATGDISIDTDGNISGTYAGADGMLDAGTGSITATVSFTTLDIAGAAATLSAGYIGAPGVADQTMANLISIGGILYPVLVPDPAYTFAAFIIGGSPPAPPGGGGGGGETGGGPTPPVLPPVPGTGPGPVTPPVTEPGGQPVTPAPETSFHPLPFDIARIQRSAEIMVLSTELPAAPACDPDSPHSSCDTLLQSR